MPQTPVRRAANARDVDAAVAVAVVVVAVAVVASSQVALLPF